MRSEQEMYELIVNTARNDERVRAVILNGSRANPNAPRDFFQDYDIVYLVTDVSAFKQDPTWIDVFGERMILQLPEAMGDPPPREGNSFAYLMQFTDGNRIDLTLYPVARLNEMEKDSLSRLLLDKDGLVPPLAPANDRDYLPQPPSAQAYADCCNEFWWVCPYVAKGLWREEILYAKSMMDPVLREQLLKMLTWYVGIRTQFLHSPGKLGKHLKRYLEPELWEMLERTYADASAEHTWDALSWMGELFRITARAVAAHFGFTYPQSDDEQVSAHLRHVRLLPKEVTTLY